MVMFEVVADDCDFTIGRNNSRCRGSEQVITVRNQVLAVGNG